MGGPMTLLFLQKQTQVWKDKYISKFITLCGAWAGSVKAVKVFAIGEFFQFSIWTCRCRCVNFMF